MNTRKKSLLLFICILVFLIILYVIIPKSEPVTIPNINKNTTGGEVEKISKGRDVQKMSDIWKLYNSYNGRYWYEYINSSNMSYNGSNRPYNGYYNGTLYYNGVPVVTPTPIFEKPLPYPRIMINYTTTWVDVLRNQTLETDYKFVIITLEIKNYGYKYFDAYPTKFRIHGLEPLVNVSTGNNLDAVLSNNSKTVGDLVVILKYGQTYGPKLTYTNSSYTIIYERISDRILGKEENIDQDNGNDKEVYYGD